MAGYLFAQKTSSFSGFELADKTGKILRKPADYRDHYGILGSWTVLDPKGNQMHLTYASPGTAEYYRQKWFVLIKDEKHRFPNNPLWGDGWGWALFKADAPDKQVATDYKKDCLDCHVPAKSTDWIYVKGYPVLQSK